MVQYRGFLPWAVQKWLNRSICRLACGLGWAEGSTSSIIFTRLRQCAHMGGHIGATWRIRLNCPCAAAMRSYVKLLWPLVFVGLFWKQECWACAGVGLTGWSGTNDPVADATGDFHEVSQYVLPGCGSRQSHRNSVWVSFMCVVQLGLCEYAAR